jgi:hypothetical protein
LLAVEGTLDEVGGVVEGELSGSQLFDGGTPVGGRGREEGVELGASFYELGVAGDDGVGGVDAVAGGQPDAGLREPCL